METEKVEGGLIVLEDSTSRVCPPSKCLDEDLHTTVKTQNEVEGRLLLNVIIRKSVTVLELLASEIQALLVGRNALLVLNLGLHVVNCIRGFNLKGASSQ